LSTWSPWATAYELDLAPEARTALEAAARELAALGHGIEELDLPPEEGYAPAFRTVWEAGAAGIPVEGDDVGRLEPLTAWLVRRGREVSARELAEAEAWLTGFERRLITAYAPYDAILTPGMAMTPRPLGWYDAEDAERNFAQQVQYTPYTSMLNVAGLPAVSLPVSVTAGGLPMGVQLVGKPGGEHVLLALGAQLERRLQWQKRHPPQW
jgi:amidase